MKMKTQTKYRGALSVEMVVAIGILATIIGVVAALNFSFGKLNRHLWAKHTCYAAGQAQMDAIAMTGKPITQEKFEALWPNVTCQVETTDGTGPWKGLTEVKLSLTAKVKKKDVHVQMTRYLPKQKGAAHDS